MKIQSKVIVVTGGGSGIGRALVLELVQEGARVAAVDINPETLEETRNMAGHYKDRISLHVLNVTDREAVEALPEQVIVEHGVVDGLINNAGIIQPFVYINDLEYSAIDKVMAVNFYGQVYLTKALLPYLLQRPEAHIVNVSSMGGFFPFPGQTMYGASKAAVKLFTEGLYSELTETNVRVTVVFPGTIDTNISQNSDVVMEGIDDEAAAGFSPAKPEEAAAEIIKGMKRNKFQVYIGKDARMMNILYWISPRRATRFMFNQMKRLLPQ